MTIKLDLQFGKPEVIGDGLKLYIPVSPESIMAHSESGWTIYDLERQAFDRIPHAFANERGEVGKRLEALGEHAILRAVGPDEGDYYIEVPGLKSE